MALIKVKERGRETVNLGRRNLIINGAMQVAQRGTSSTGISTGGYYTVDRYRLAYNGSPDELRFTQEKSTDAPAGFGNSLKLTVTTAETTVAADERVRLQQRIEGQNLQNLKYGTSNAEYLTISFYVKSNVTGTYGIHLNNTNSTRSVCASYTIGAANTWEKKTISIAGDTTGTFTNDNGRSLDFCWTLAAGTDYTSGTLATSWEASTNANEAPSGQPNLISTVNNTWQITGVQLELGSTATDFEHRSFGEELSLCQRYYEKSYEQGTNPATNTYVGVFTVSGGATGSTASYIGGFGVKYMTEKRSTPTVVVYDKVGNSGKIQRWQLGVANSDNNAVVIDAPSSTGFHAYSASGASASGLLGHYTVDAEL
jgi:hypothetical protein